MKNPTLAFLLSLFLPGAGLCYLGKWGWGVVNLLVVLAIGMAVVYLFNGSYAHYLKDVSVGMASGSGALAMAAAKNEI